MFILYKLSSRVRDFLESGFSFSEKEVDDVAGELLENYGETDADDEDVTTTGKIR